jgi:ABC-2 type transport system permease protein
LSLARAASLIWIAGIRNRIRRQIQRMKQPKYLIATLAGALYFWTVLGRRFRFAGGAMQLPAELIEVLQVALVLVALVSILSAWIFGGDKAELTFSEAEIQFLFPAPVTRRALLNFRLAKSLLRTFLSALVMTLFSGRWITGQPLMFLVGSWLCLATLSLHLTGAALTRSSLLESGRFGLRRRLGTLAIGLAAIGAIVWWAVDVNKPDLPEAWSFESALAWMRATMSSAPLSWVLFPVRAPIRAALARDFSQFASSLPTALGILAIHYGWVISSNVAFEEASVEAAERRARAREARRSRGARGGGVPAVKSRIVPFRLRPTGRPEIGLIWKNLIAAMRVSVPRMLLFMIAMGLASSVSLMRRFPVLPVVGAACALLVPVLVLLGPNAMRIDFRQDLSQIDILRSFPMTGRQVVRAEMLGPALIVAALQWVLLAAAVALSASFPLPGFELPKRIAVALSAALLAPALVLVNLAIQNAGVLLFPSWASFDPGQARGIEALGQRLLTLAGTLFVFFFALLPATLFGGAVAAIFWRMLNFAALPIASAVAAAVIAFELQLSIRWLGRVFDRFDVTAP